MDGPRKQEQLEDIKAIIRNMGEAGIPVMGYYFSLAGVNGWTKGPWARGGAVAVGYVESMAPAPSPIPAGQIWNMTYDASAPSRESIPATSEEEVWSRLTEFLREVVPVAEEARVRLASHPDDPPLPVLRETGRLIYNPERYQRLLDIVPNHHNALEFCVGAISEMNGDMDIYQAIDAYSKQGKIAYVHLRNVRGKVPNYHEVFVDEGDTDMFRVLRILYDNGFEGVIIPDHVPEMTCDAPWHAGMAHALGWMRATLTAIERGKI
jgi:mannonate dehydratase